MFDKTIMQYIKKIDYQMALALLLRVPHHQASFLVLASLVLEPNPNDPRTEARHFHQLFLHEGVRSGVSTVTGLQHAELRLAQNRPHTRGSL